MFNKQMLRKEMKRRLMLIDESQYQRWSHEIAVRLINSEVWKSVDTIGITISRGKEVNTFPIIMKAWEIGKKVVVPKCYPNEKSMKFFKITNFAQLEEVYFGLKEPIISETEEVNQNEIGLLIVPGVCYSLDGYRVGYGGGYYDRFLKSYNRHTLSLLFECQLIEKIPIETFDIPVHQLLTEERTINCHD